MTLHLIFFDSSCPLCQKAVGRIKAKDSLKEFEFFPLTSELAKEKLPPELLEGDTLVLLEDGEKTWLRAKAIFRIIKLLDGKYSWFGALAYLPGVDLAYRLVAHNRHFFK